eukprot:1940596-Rhodomonas_salina.1
MASSKKLNEQVQELLRGTGLGYDATDLVRDVRYCARACCGTAPRYGSRSCAVLDAGMMLRVWYTVRGTEQRNGTPSQYTECGTEQERERADEGVGGVAEAEAHRDGRGEIKCIRLPSSYKEGLLHLIAPGKIKCDAPRSWYNACGTCAVLHLIAHRMPVFFLVTDADRAVTDVLVSVSGKHVHGN